MWAGPTISYDAYQDKRLTMYVAHQRVMPEEITRHSHELARLAIAHALEMDWKVGEESCKQFVFHYRGRGMYGISGDEY